MLVLKSILLKTKSGSGFMIHRLDRHTARLVVSGDCEVKKTTRQLVFQNVTLISLEQLRVAREYLFSSMAKR